MAGELEAKLNAIHLRHVISQQDLSLRQQTLIENYPRLLELQLASLVCGLRQIRPEGGINPDLLRRSIVVSPDIVVVDEDIATLCQMPYFRPDGRLLACGGFRHHRSGCPGSPGVTTATQTQAELAKASAVVIVQADGLTDLDQQKELHQTLLAIESSMETKRFGLARSWSAGPCRVCEPEQECQGFGKCRQPKKRRYSMEGSSISVIATCDRIARLTGDDSWKIRLIDHWGLPNQSSPSFKSVVALAVR